MVRAMHGQGQRAFLELVLDLVPQGGLVEGFFDEVVHALADAVDARSVGDVVVHRLGEGVGFLEHHPDPAAHLDRVDVVGVKIFAVVGDLPGDPRPGHEIVHPIEAAQYGALAAPGWTDHGGDLTAPDRHVDAPDGLVGAVVDTNVGDLEHGVGQARRAVEAVAPDSGLNVRQGCLGIFVHPSGLGHRVVS